MSIGKCRIAVAIIAAVLLSASSSVRAAVEAAATVANPPGCDLSAVLICEMYSDAAALNKITGAELQVGQTVYYRAKVKPTGNQCAVSGGGIYLITPDGVHHGITPVGGIPLVCGEPTCSPTGVAEVLSEIVSYTVTEADFGRQTYPISGCDIPAPWIQAFANYTGGVAYCSGSCGAQGSVSLCNSVIIPDLTITKQVACLPSGQTACGESLSYSNVATGIKTDSTAAFCYEFVVSNPGNIQDVITNLSDTVLGDLLADFVAANGGSDVLEANQTVTFFKKGEHTQTTQNTVTVSGYDGLFNTALSANDSANAIVKLAALSCSAEASWPEQYNCPGQAGKILTGVAAIPVTYSVTVKNDGDATLTGVTVTDDRCGTVGTITTLAPGASATVSCTTDVDTRGCVPGGQVSIDNAFDLSATTATADSECPKTLSKPNACDVKIACCGTPNILIEKTVACYDAPECDTFGEIAYGVKSSSQCPAFCYRLVVTNTGDVPLTDVVVADPDLDLSGCTFKTELAVGESTECIVSGVERCADLLNKATATGVGSGQTVVDDDTAQVFIKNASITCTKEVSLDGDTYKNHVEIPDDGQPHAVWYRITVSNTSDPGVTLGKLLVSDPMLSGCDLTAPETLASGDSFTVGCVVSQTCAGVEIVNTATVSGEVVASEQVKCVKDWEGKVISVAHQCTASVGCIPQPKEGCRTTGGGKQYTSENQTCPTDVRYVTHGGQVGASFGVAGAPSITNCVTGEGIGFWNPCIRGEYEHVRHMKGGRRANFHAASNGHENQFDSLGCACLPCDSFDTTNSWPTTKLTCHPADRTYTNSGEVVEGLCNPGDRACGPEPRKAPANKIAFSGVGDYTESKGKKVANAVVFRVDIEDRGEPGNAHAIGASGKDKKIDRYRIRMWKITGDPDSAYNRALRVAVAVTNAADERVLTELPCGFGATPEPDIDDGGDLDRGNRQIHPMTGATCK